MTSMNTLVCQEPKILRWEKRQIPIPGDDEVLIKIKTVGICGTDIHAHFICDYSGEGGFSQSRRTVEQNVIQGFLSFLCRLNIDL